MADEHREIAQRMAHRIGPARIAIGQLGTPWPAQTCKRRLRCLIEADAAVGIGQIKILRRRRRRCGFTSSTEPITAFGPVRRDSLEPRVPRLEVEVLELRERIVLRNIHRLADRGVDVRLTAALMRM